jgi:hypothetical protein
MAMWFVHVPAQELMVIATDNAALPRLQYADMALLDEILHPALAPVRRSHPVGRGLDGAVNAQEGGPPHVLGRQRLDIDVALHDLLPRLADTFAANTEIAVLADRRYRVRSVFLRALSFGIPWGGADSRSEERR